MWTVRRLLGRVLCCVVTLCVTQQVLLSLLPNLVSVHHPVPPTTTPTATTLQSGWQILGERPHVRLTMFNQYSKNKQLNDSQRPKLILTTTGDFSQMNLNGCPDYECHVISDQTRMSEADAIVFKMGSGTTHTANRLPHQYYVFFTQESPLHSGASEPYPGFYNLTMGYRRDCDLPCPYGYTIKLNKQLSVDQVLLNENELDLKNKTAAWFVSNCQAPSKRQDYVSELQKYIRVDVFGACGPFSCAKQTAGCNRMLSEQYRFYLAFENSVCVDYITEKLWSQGYKWNVIPVVLKGSVIAKYVPPDSYLAADNFTSAQALAEHMHLLMNDNERYARYFAWKRHYEVVFLDGVQHDYRERPWGFCRLCRLLWTSPRPTIVRYDFRSWWRNETTCDSGLVERII